MGTIVSRQEEEDDIAHRFQTHRAEITECLPLHLETLLYKCIEVHLLKMEDLVFYQKHHIPMEEKRHKLISVIEQNKDGYSKFLRCIQTLKEHMGYEYIASILEGRNFADKAEIEESATYRARIIENMPKMEHINLKVLCPILAGKKLITHHELDNLTSTRQFSELEKNSLLFSILSTKGPTAYKRFVECLGEEDSHIYHKELFELLHSSGTDEDGSTSVRKRKRTVMSSPQKRQPKLIEMHGVLKTEKYAKMVRCMRHWVSNGQWNKTDEVECIYLNEQGSQPLPITVANLLQGVIARIVRKDYAKAQGLLELCDRLIPKIEGDNNTILRGRCKYTWSWLFKYLKQLGKAKECARDAMQILFNVERGEDTALANYGYASVLVDCQACAQCSDPEEIKTAEECLKFAMDHARIEDRGLDHIEAHSQLRLAQKCLGSTHYEPGENTDPESIKEASDHLKAIDLGSLPPRSRCIFFLTESDLYRNKGNADMAIASATNALEIAEKSGFETEIVSAKTKLTKLGT